MKKIIMISLALILSLPLASCSGNGGEITTEPLAESTNAPQISLLETTLPETAEEVTTEPAETAEPKDLSNAVLTEIFEAKRILVASKVRMTYRIYVPADYDAGKSYPLVVFLHGAGERGTDNAAQFKNGIGQLFKKVGSPLFDCIIIAPQCPGSMKWVDVAAWTDCNYSTDKIPESIPMQGVLQIIEETEKAYNVDTDRRYVTGISMGGYGTWDLLIRHGDMFAAGIPVCGGCDVSKAAQLVDVPIMTFHGALDPTVPNKGTLSMVSAIKAAGGTKIELIEYPNGKHNIWEDAYATDGLAEWLLSHKLSDRK